MLLHTLCFVSSVAATVVEYHEDFTDISSSDGGLEWVESTDPVYEATDFKLVDTKEIDGGDKVLSPEISAEGNHFAIAAHLPVPVPFADAPPLVFQYEVTYASPVSCGGSYVKLLTASDEKASDLNGDSKYTIMFGPDYCGGNKKIHFIFTLENPTDPSKTMEVHCKQGDLDSEFFSDGKSHLLTLILNGDNSYLIKVDNEEHASGSIGNEEDCTPQPEKTIKDPSDTKPADWVEDPEIADPEHVKPADWVTEEEIADPTATQPEDWIEDDDGAWEAPMIANPDYTVWDQKMVENPAYKGPWEQKDMANPDYFHEANPFSKLKPFDAIAFELVVNDPGLQFDNVYFSSNVEGATKKADSTWAKRRKLQDDAEEKVRAEEDERMRLEEERRRQAELDAVSPTPFGSFFDSEPTIAMVAGLVTLVMIHLGNTL